MSGWIGRRLGWGGGVPCTWEVWRQHAYITPRTSCLVRLCHTELLTCLKQIYIVYLLISSFFLSFCLFLLLLYHYLSVFSSFISCSFSTSSFLPSFFWVIIYFSPPDMIYAVDAVKCQFSIYLSIFLILFRRFSSFIPSFFLYY